MLISAAISLVTHSEFFDRYFSPSIIVLLWESLINYRVDIMVRLRRCPWAERKTVFLAGAGRGGGSRFITRWYCGRIGKWCPYRGRAGSCQYSRERGQAVLSIEELDH